MASARSRAGRVLVSRSTVTAAPPTGHLWGQLPYVPPNGAKYTDRYTVILQYTTLLTVCTPSSVLLLQRETTMATAQPAGRSRRSASARIQSAATTLFHRDRIRSHRDGTANRTRQCAETHVLLAPFRMNEYLQEYLRRIHEAGGVPTNRSSSPRTPRRAAAHLPSIAHRAAISAAFPFITPPSMQAEM
jgi:hypothetical protein